MAKDEKYRAAVERLDEILREIDDDNTDVDELSMRVKEAVELLRHCKSKIDKAEIEVKKVVDDLGKEPKDT